MIFFFLDRCLTNIIDELYDFMEWFFNIFGFFILNRK